MKKIGGDETIGVIICIYMGISQGNSLCSYLYLNKAKISCFSFYLFSFFFYKNQRTGEQNKSCPGGRAGTSGREEVWGQAVRG
jgi:hypothetical protein